MPKSRSPFPEPDEMTPLHMRILDATRGDGLGESERGHSSISFH